MAVTPLEDRILIKPLEKETQTASGIFAASGYLPIGMDHFAKPEDDLTRAFEGGRLKRSFMGYEANPAPDMLGVGPSAISYLDGAYLRNVPSLFAWNHAIEHGGQGQDVDRLLQLLDAFLVGHAEALLLVDDG